MPGNSEVLVFQKEKPEPAKEKIEQADTIFCLDFSSLNRINELGEMVRTSNAIKVLVDHHLEPGKFAHFEQWDDTAASTAELVYQLIYDLGDEKLINDSIANLSLRRHHDRHRRIQTPQHKLQSISDRVTPGSLRRQTPPGYLN